MNLVTLLVAVATFIIIMWLGIVNGPLTPRRNKMALAGKLPKLPRGYRWRITNYGDDYEYLNVKLSREYIFWYRVQASGLAGLVEVTTNEDTWREERRPRTAIEVAIAITKQANALSARFEERQAELAQRRLDKRTARRQAENMSARFTGRYS